MTAQEQWLCDCTEATERSYLKPQFRGGGREKVPYVQGKEKQLCFVGAALKRYPTSKVRETQVRW